METGVRGQGECGQSSMYSQVHFNGTRRGEERREYLRYGPADEVVVLCELWNLAFGSA